MLYNFIMASKISKRDLLQRYLTAIKELKIMTEKCNKKIKSLSRMTVNHNDEGQGQFGSWMNTSLNE